MLISIVFFIITSDSLPPIPDLVRIRFPEPPLWVEPEPNFINLSGYAGDFYGAQCHFKYNRFRIAGLYTQEYTWDSITSGVLHASYSLPLPRVWVRPAFYGYLMHRDEEYRVLVPSLQFTSMLPWAIVHGAINYDFWQIDKTHDIEEQARLSIIFDKVPFLPSLEVSELYTHGTIKPAIGIQAHIRNVHFNIGSSIFHGFPSPCAEIAYREPKIKIETSVKSGVMYQTLQDYFDPALPVHYRIPVPEESLNIEAAIRFEFDLYEHMCALYGSFKDWKSRLVAGDEFEISNLHDVQEASIGVMFKNHFARKIVNAHNVFYVHYNWTDSNIPFLPEYSVVDTVRIQVGYIEIASALHYISERHGLTKALPSMFIIHPRLGIVFQWLKIYVAIYNATDKQTERFDGYFLYERRYAGGLEINYKF